MNVMLLIFSVGEDRYGLDVAHVVEVIPCIPLKSLPRAPDYVAGMFNYRNVAVPVIDVSALISGAPARRFLSTRIILVNYPAANGSRHVLGLIAEHVTETVKYDRSSFIASRVGVQDGEFLGALAMDDKGMVQCLEIEKLLPADMREVLFRAEAPLPPVSGASA